jgi:predicted secreted protein with PEFG-CTERM motif
MMISSAFAQTPDTSTDPTANAGDPASSTDPGNFDQTGSNATDPDSMNTGGSSDITGNDTIGQDLTPPDLDTISSNANGTDLTTPENNVPASQSVPEFGPVAAIILTAATLAIVLINKSRL